MRLGLNERQLRFVATVRSFLRQHWPASLDPGASTDDGSFLAALCARGWSVPDWPVAHGGTNWGDDERYLFDRELALVGAPRVDAFSVDVMGQLVIKEGTTRQRDDYLPVIREARGSCCAHGSLRGGTPLEVKSNDGGLILRHRVVYAHAAAAADWLVGLALSPAGRSTLVVLSLPSDAVTTGLPLDPHRIQAAGQPLDVLGEEGGGESLIDDALEQARCVPRSSGGRLRWKLADSQRLLARARVPADPTRSARLAALEISILSLEMLEQRVVTASATAVGLMSAEAAVVRTRSRSIERELAAITIDSLGYYALPDPEPTPGDNEGPVGPRFSRDAISELFGYVEGLGVLSDELSERDRIAALKHL